MNVNKELTNLEYTNTYLWRRPVQFREYFSSKSSNAGLQQILKLWKIWCLHYEHNTDLKTVFFLHNLLNI